MAYLAAITLNPVCFGCISRVISLLFSLGSNVRMGISSWEEIEFEFIRRLHLFLDKNKVSADVNKGIYQRETITLTPAISSFHNRTQH